MRPAQPDLRNFPEHLRFLHKGADVMWAYEQARDYLISALRREADAQELGRLDEIGTKFEEFDVHLPRNADPEFHKLHIALNFWDSWGDARNHDWLYYEPIQKQDWPRLARSIAAQIEANEEISESLVLERFELRKREPPPVE